METIRSLEKVSNKMLFEAFQEAFKGYEMQLTQSELLKMLERRGFTPELSFGAFSGEKLVSLTFNGTGNFNDLFTAYDSGTGTIEKYRGKGLASRIFEYSIPHLKRAGISQYLLEVLQHNSKAVSLYKRLGFEVSREFNYFIESSDKLRQPSNNPDPVYRILSTDLSEKDRMRSFWDHQPSWQNSFEAVERIREDFLILGAFREDKLLGYCIFEPGSGDITQLAVDKRFRREGIASLLLQNAFQSNQYESVKAINYETDQAGFNRLMESFGITLKGTQFEMVKQL
ncbi:MAG: GNAT family N-acetyltransferase [Bacteroidales bacterium]|nr:GNAT family N-acetyltransferase [Bacteroidales bacterium]